MKDYWYVLKINPEPWAMGEAFTGRRNRGFYAGISPNQQLKAYQNAVREELDGVDKLPDGQYDVEFYLWRELATYISDSDRRVQKHQADATNMQKALEDACQGVLFDNDRDVQKITTEIVEQGPNVKPCIVIHIKLYTPFDYGNLPEGVWRQINAEPVSKMDNREYEEAEELF